LIKDYIGAVTICANQSISQSQLRVSRTRMALTTYLISTELLKLVMAVRLANTKRKHNHKLSKRWVLVFSNKSLSTLTCINFRCINAALRIDRNVMNPMEVSRLATGAAKRTNNLTCFA
jgi:hypothetical protein